MKAYINNCIGEMPSQDGSYVRHTVGACRFDCSSLDRFLSDPARTVGRFSVSKQRSQHLHSIIDAAGIDCTHKSERIGFPQTLVVTKTFRHCERDVTAWRKRKAEAGLRLLDFNKRDLTVQLGEEYEGLMGMVGLGPSSGRRPARTVSPPPPRVSRGQARPSASIDFNSKSKKRKAADIDMVDLTGDD